MTRRDARNVPGRNRLSSCILRGSSATSVGSTSTKSSRRLSVSEIAEERKPFTEQTPFVSFLCIESIVNLVILGLEAEFKCKSNCDDVNSAIWLNLGIILSVTGIIEMALAMSIAGCLSWWQGGTVDSRVLRIVDLICVISRAADSIFQMGGVDTGFRFFSAWRILHMGKFTKLVLYSRGTIVLNILSEAMRTVFWLSLILIMLFWVFGIILKVLTETSLSETHFPYGWWVAEDYWGTVPRSCFSLFQVLTGDTFAVSPLFAKNSLTIFPVLFFLSITLLALLSTVFGVVVECTHRHVREDRAKRESRLKELESQIFFRLRVLAEGSDENGDGTLDAKEVELLHLPHCRQQFAVLGISKSDVRFVFDLLSSVEPNGVNIDKFYIGLGQVQGNAQAFHVENLNRSIARENMKFWDLLKSAERTRKSIDTLVNKIAELDRDVVRAPEDISDPILSKRRELKEIAKLVTGSTDELNDANPDLATQLETSKKESPKDYKKVKHSLRKVAKVRNTREKPQMPMVPPGIRPPPLPEYPKILRTTPGSPKRKSRVIPKKK